MSEKISVFFEQTLNIRPISQLECTQCKHKVERPYKEKEYVNKIVEDKCPKCQSTMYVRAIYVYPQPKQL
jgi:hypothetical protein